MTDHGVYDDGGPDMAFSAPRCARCSSWAVREVTAGWWCLDCDLVAPNCTRAWWLKMSEQRALWAKGEHPAQRPPAPPVPQLHVPHEHAPCRVCGEAHATAPDPHPPRPQAREPSRFAPELAARRRDRQSAWWTASSGHDPEGTSLAWPLGTDDEPHEPATTGAIDPVEADARLLEDMDDHRGRRSA
jgi:hypothetical protein